MKTQNQLNSDAQLQVVNPHRRMEALQVPMKEKTLFLKDILRPFTG